MLCAKLRPDLVCLTTGKGYSKASSRLSRRSCLMYSRLHFLAASCFSSCVSPLILTSGFWVSCSSATCSNCTPRQLHACVSGCVCVCLCGCVWMYARVDVCVCVYLSMQRCCKKPCNHTVGCWFVCKNCRHSWFCNCSASSLAVRSSQSRWFTRR